MPRIEMNARPMESVLMLSPGTAVAMSVDRAAVRELHRLARHGRHRDRHVDQRFLALARGDDEFLERDVSFGFRDHFLRAGRGRGPGQGKRHRGCDES